MQHQEGAGFRVERGPYLGDVSALCFLPSPASSSRLPLLIAGTGPQVLLFELATGKLLLSQQVFDGVRVHGIHALPAILPPPSDAGEFESAHQATIAVHGERRVKVFERGCSDSTTGISEPEFRLVQSLPRFFQWILDVRFLQEETSVAGAKGKQILLAVGLSDNSVAIWDLQRCAPTFRVECSERCLLYSLRLWGSSIKTLRVAAGTIFNKVLIWDLSSWSDEERLRNHLEPSAEMNKRGENAVPFAMTVKPLQELLGHEGSIHRISWSVDGRHVASASDDRSARIWTSSSLDKDLFAPGPVLYGHGGRLWDCHIADNLLITASEDCTCRLWTPQGHHLATLTGHTGRGIWRCVYDQETATLVTAGADSAIKVQSLAKWEEDGAQSLPEPGEAATEDLTSLRQPSSSDDEVFRIALMGPNVVGAGPSNRMDSNSEYVRCLGLAGPRTLYIATNQGHVHYVALLENNKQVWTKLFQSEGTGPIVCMSLFVGDWDEDSCPTTEVVAFGNGLGTATALGVCTDGPWPVVIWRCTWVADHERQLLGAFCCKSLGKRYIFTTDPRGLVRVWVLQPCLATGTIVEGQLQALLVAVCQSPWHARIVCLDVCPSAQLLVCGDQRGNLASFLFPNRLVQQNGAEPPAQLPSVGVFKGAHGISAVASVSVTKSSTGQAAHIVSTGRDGCICKFSIDTDSSDRGLVCTGVEDITAITVVESVERCQGVDRRKTERRVAAGFIASDFILWDLSHQSELMHVTCGGWRRPHSCVVGNIPEHQHCFAFLKDQVIYVHRNWAPLPLLADGDVPNDGNPESFPTGRATSLLPQSLHGQFHGREIHSVHFIPSEVGPLSSRGRSSRHWMATGAEDGAVRITRYDVDGIEKLESMMVLGEHTGGSAVRALTLVQGAHALVQEPPPSLGRLHTQDPLLLLSVGAKEVLTCWLLEWQQGSADGTKDASGDKAGPIGRPVPQANCVQFPKNPVEQTLSSTWLSSYAPPRTHQALNNKEERAAKSCAKTLLPTPESSQEKREKEKKANGGSRKGVKEDDDLRFLAVTAFSVHCSGTGSVFCFVVTASSNASLRLLAFNVASRAWVEVAVLEYHSVPVLALQHLVVPLDSSISGFWRNGYLIISGATDGSIAVWDITNLVVTFTKQAATGSLNLQSSSDTAALRPRTGRGSQGGRRWRVSKQREAGLPRNSKKKDDNTADVNQNFVESAPENQRSTQLKENLGAGSEETGIAETHICEVSEVETLLQGRDVAEGDPVGREGKKACKDSSIPPPYQASTLLPLETFAGAHQSGVNCMSAARVAAAGGADPVYVVVSGGDDQALHVIRFTARLCGTGSGELPCAPRVAGDSKEEGSGGAQAHEGKFSGDSMGKLQLALECLSRAWVPGAHSSAVKGIWTDDTWAFSTGLDQRLRCWHLAAAPSIQCKPPSQKNEMGLKSREPISLPAALVECSQCVIDVPEAEDLHVEPNLIRGQYQIAVVGRGLQVMSFSSS